MLRRAVFCLSAVLSLFPAVVNMAENSERWHPTIPKTWDKEDLAGLELPLAYAAASPEYIPADYYYRIPVRPVYKSYPVYYPGKEPSDYLSWLQQQEPAITFDSSTLITEQDWIRAGELVFDAPIDFVSASELLYSETRGKAWFDKNQVRLTKEGIFPNMRYVVREKGKVELGILACAMCHTRVMENGTVIKGAQGNFPDDRAFAYEVRLEAARAKDQQEVLQDLRVSFKRNYAAPWLKEDPNARTEQMSIDELASALEAIPPGVCARQGSSVFYPAQVPDLIGLKDRKYFDAAGTVRHRSIGDLMRYAALNQGADLLSTYNGFRPHGELPDPASLGRYSDEQLYALALYLYSLSPPENPNKPDERSARGKVVFEQAGCTVCHPGPLYTNNQLTPSNEFKVPPEHVRSYDVLQMSVDTDPDLTMKSRRGSGYYKVPSLKGVWYRGPFGHGGWVATLEDWFDPRRLKEDYIPTAYRRHGVKTGPVKGHAFGLALPKEDREALIAFLKTL